MKLTYLIKGLILVLILSICKSQTSDGKKNNNGVLIAKEKDSTTYDAPGKLIDIGGRNMHILVSGENNTGPTVIFFHGAGDIALNWNLVLPKVGQFARAIAFDQAGEGWSDHGHGMALNQQVYDSYLTLQKANIKPPYIVVGHSLGGIIANLFAATYNNDVVGVVLVDATHPDVVLKIYNKETKKMEWKKMRMTAKRDIPRVNTSILTEPKVTSSFQPRKDFGNMLDKFSDRDKKLFNWIYNQRPWTYVKGQSYTYEAEIFQDMYINKEKYRLKDIPLLVITGGNKSVPDGDDNWTSERLVKHSKSLEKDLLNLSTNSKQIVASNSGHNIHIDEPELVSKAIKELINK